MFGLMAEKLIWIYALTLAVAAIPMGSLPGWGLGPCHCFAQPAAQSEMDRQGGQVEVDGDRQAGHNFRDDKIEMGVSVELNGSYSDISDEGDTASGDLWDAYIGLVGFQLGVIPTGWLRFDLLVEIEDIGKHGASATAALSEAFVTLHYPDFPVYFIGGKRKLPFGVFEDRMISGTLTEELYEIDDVGATLGIQIDGLHSDLLLTLYDGQQVIENLEQFNTHQFAAGRDRTNRIDSYILTLKSEPIAEVLSFSLFFNSESGDGDRNETIGAAVSGRFFDFTLDTEYIQALKRELGEDGDPDFNDDEQNLETAWFLAVAYQPVDTIEAALRYEHFDDDRSGQQDEVVDYRYLAGLNYFIKDYATLSFEYRHTELERESGSNAAEAVNEYKLQLALKF